VPPLGELLSALPTELQLVVEKHVDSQFPISIDKAKELRLELMQERSHFAVRHTDGIESAQFDLCEH
jgi:N-acyl-L-homoserine lactone synthetase